MHISGAHSTHDEVAVTVDQSSLGRSCFQGVAHGGTGSDPRMVCYGAITPGPHTSKAASPQGQSCSDTSRSPLTDC